MMVGPGAKAAQHRAEGDSAAELRQAAQPADGGGRAGGEAGGDHGRDLVDQDDVDGGAADHRGRDPAAKRRSAPRRGERIPRAAMSPGSVDAASNVSGAGQRGPDEHDEGQRGLDAQRARPPECVDQPRGEREKDRAGEGAEDGQPHHGAGGLVSGGAHRRGLGDVVEAQRGDDPAAQNVGDGEREQPRRHRRHRQSGRPQDRGDDKRQPRSEAVNEPAAGQAADPADDQHRAEDGAQRRRGPPSALVDRVDQDPVGVVGHPIGDVGDQAEDRDADPQRPLGRL